MTEWYLTAEARSRVEIDRQLVARNWVVQDHQPVESQSAKYAAQANGMNRGHTLPVPSTTRVGVSDRGGELS